MQKLTTKLDFWFDDQDDSFNFNVDMKIKTRKKPKHIIIEEHKKKTEDSLTKLF